MEKQIKTANPKEEYDMIDGVTTCCGYDFGTDMAKAKYCPICGKKLIRIKAS